MKERFLILAAVLAVFMLAGCSGKYETVKGDPMGTKIYTLDNGLKVYMTVNKEQPRLQTYIAVRSSGKNDPSDNTGLAHYLEHLMFKGTEQLGTSDYAAEKPMLDEIESLYNVYRTKTDQKERLAIYHVIDSISNVASKYAIPNEYDKAMQMIGSQGSNAFTSNDVTCYQEDIPSNQIENWAKIQSGRFKNMVIRGFHTELEAVYEEKNRGLNDDGEKAIDAIDSMLFKNHPYGTQTVIGTQDHLKNPSITAIKHQFATMYVPNNCAICVSGDFDPDEFVAIIEKYFGDWKPNDNLPEFTYAPEEPITAPKSKDVYGTEAEFTMLAWRYPGQSTPEGEIGSIVSSILYNGQAGLIDLDVNQEQKVLEAAAFGYGRTDYGMMVLEAYPKEGQTLQEATDVLLAEVDKLRRGDFDESLITASVNNYKLQQMRSLERNSSRAMKFVDSFIDGCSWEETVGQLGRLEKVTKEDVVAWAGKWLAPQGYAVVYKHLGIDNSIKKIDAPKITPIATNRDKESTMLAEIRTADIKPIEPVFTDFSKDMTASTYAGGEFLYKKNELNDIATLVLSYDTGILDDAALPLAFDYLDYLGTKERSASELATAMYGLASSFSANVSDGTTSIMINGLGENIGSALDMVWDLVQNASADEDVLAGLKADMLKNRSDSKLNQRANFSAMSDYLRYGPDYIKATTLSNKALMDITSEELLSKVRSLAGKQHRILYYGPQSIEEVTAMLQEHHKVSGQPEPLTRKYAKLIETPSAEVIVAPYDARQFNYTQFSNRGETYDASNSAGIRLFNEYFGGGMGGVVFQEMREARALAYSAGARLSEPSYKNGPYTFTATIGSQNDKLHQAVETFDSIINDMPESDKAFDNAKAGLLSRLRTNRTTGIGVLNSYLICKELGLSEPVDKAVFELVQGMELKDLKAVQEKWVKGRTYHYGIVGDIADLDMPYLKSLGPVKVVTSEEIFGY